MKLSPFKLECPFMGGNQRDSTSMVPGVWMGRSGDIIPIDYTHEDSAKELFGEGGMQVAYSRGFVRVTISAWNCTLAISGPKPTPRQMRNLRDWALFHHFTLQNSTGIYANGILQ